MGSQAKLGRQVEEGWVARGWRAQAGRRARAGWRVRAGLRHGKVGSRVGLPAATHTERGKRKARPPRGIDAMQASTPAALPESKGACGCGTP